MNSKDVLLRLKPQHVIMYIVTWKDLIKFFVHTLHVLGNCYNLGSIIKELVKRFCDLLATNGYFLKKSHLNITVYPNYTKIKFSKLHPDKLGIEKNIWYKSDFGTETTQA